MEKKENNSKKTSPKKASIKKKPKKKISKYDEKIVVDASFEELIKELVTPKKK